MNKRQPKLDRQLVLRLIFATGLSDRQIRRLMRSGGEPENWEIRNLWKIELAQ